MAAQLTKTIRISAFFTLVLLTLMLITTMSANAQASRCTNHDNLTTHLKERYGEKPRGIGMVSEQGIMQVYVSKKGTWTILVTNPRGQACLIAAGKGWEDLKVTYDEPEA